MWIIDLIKRRKAKKAIARKLPRILKKRYGRHKRYSKKQIDSACSVAKIDSAYIYYAYAIFMPKSEFLKVQQDNYDYDTIRNEISHSFFDGNSNFTIHDALDGSSHGGAFWGDSGGFGDGGSDSGVDF